MLRGKYGKGKVVIVDDEDYIDLIKYKWFLSSPGLNRKQYVRCRIGNNTDIRIHRFLMSAKMGQMVDHKNGNTLDNRRDNLRFCTNQENQRNSKRHSDKLNINGIYVPKGIKYDKSRPNRPWIGRISINGERISTKGFKNIEDCIKCYSEMVGKFYGEFARLS